MFHASHGALGAYFKPAEMFLVFGGAIGAAMLSMPLHNFTSAVNFVKKWLFNKEAHIEHLIKEMVEYAETARRDGVLALESSPARPPDPFLRRGLQLTIDGTDPEIIERILRIEIEAMTERHKHGKHLFGTHGQVRPRLRPDGDADRPGRHVPQPRRRRQRDRQRPGHRPDRHALRLHAPEPHRRPDRRKAGASDRHEEVFAKEIILQGVLSIQAGNNPRVVEMQLLSFLSTKQQAALPKAA